MTRRVTLEPYGAETDGPAAPMTSKNARPINLVMVAPYPQDPRRPERGVETITVTLVEELKRIEQLHVQIISCLPGVRQAYRTEFNGTPVHFLPTTKRFSNITFGFDEQRRVRNVLAELSPDVIHVHYHFAYPYLFSRPIAPVVTHVHGITFKESPFEEDRLDRFRRIPRNLLERLVLRKAARVISITEYVRDTIAPLTNAELSVVENPVNARFFRTTNREVPNRLLFAGAIIPRKNILDLLKAVHMLRSEVDVMLHIVGVVEDARYHAILLEYVHTHQLERHVSFRGVLSDDELLREYEESAVVVLPSLEESAGMALQQAMAASKAVVATRVGGIPCIVRDGVTGLLTEPGNVAELAGAMRALLDDHELRRAMGAAGRVEADNRFEPAVMAGKLHDAYCQLLNSSSA